MFMPFGSRNLYISPEYGLNILNELCIQMGFAQFNSLMIPNE
jgi:hypothetical protein